jgi:LAS superfamily LD-carboxypeptidase LdcB
MLKGKHYILLSAVGAILCIGIAAISFPRLNTYGQNSIAPVASPAQTISTGSKEIVVIKNTPSATPDPLTQAMQENPRLKDTLVWNFGAKEQRGWHLYAALIRQTVGTESDETTNKFARAVAVWQAKNGLSETGTIDRETLYRLIEFWQSRRVNSSVYPADQDLLSAPITDFYDSTRAVELLKVERETYQAYKKMVASAAAELKLKTNKNGELAADEKFLKIISAFRSREYQAKLRAASPQSGRAGLATNSPHFTGRALDIYVGGEPTITKDYNRAVQVQTPAYQWLVKNAARFGFYPYFYEPWHWEYVPQNLPLTKK